MELVLVIHGTFASNATWWQSGSSFCTKLEAALNHRDLNAACWMKVAHDAKDENDAVRNSYYYFRWSGLNDHHARLSAGEDLAFFISHRARIGSFSKIHIVAHSHGGNVLLEALDFIQSNPLLRRELTDKLGVMITLGTPFYHFGKHKNKLTRFATASGALILSTGLFLISYPLLESLLLRLAVCAGIAFWVIFAGWVLFGPGHGYRRNWKGPTLRVIASQHDEAIRGLQACAIAAKTRDEIAGKLSPTRWKPFFTTRSRLLRKYSKDVTDGKYADELTWMIGSIVNKIKWERAEALPRWNQRLEAKLRLGLKKLIKPRRWLSWGFDLVLRVLLFPIYFFDNTICRTVGYLFGSVLT